MDALIQACKAFSGKTSADEKLDAAKKLRQLALGLAPSDVAAVGQQAGDWLDHFRGLLVGTRVGLVPGESAMDASKAAALRLATYKRGLGMLAAEAELPESDAGQVVSLLDSELGGMVSTVDISEVVDVAIEIFESDCPNSCAALDLIPKALMLLGSLGGQVDLAGDDGSTSACQVSDFCQGIVQKVCQHDWPQARIAKVLLALRDFPLTPETLQLAVQKAMARSRTADVHDLPSIVHQLLMLSAKGCRDRVLLEVVRLFEQREAALGPAGSEQQQQGGGGAQAAVARRQLLEVQGSVLLHMDMAIKHDAELGQAWLRYLRSDSPRISAFMLAVSFMLAAIQRFEQPVTDALKALIMGTLKDAASLAASPWLPSQHAQQGAGPQDSLLGPSYALLRGVLLQCVRNSAHGQGGIVQPMAQLAMTLVESGGAADKGHSACYNADGSLEGQGAPPAALACDLGMRMLLELFQGQKEFRRDLVAMFQARLIGAKEEAAAPFVRLIALLVRQHGDLVAEYINDFKVSLENLAFLPPNAALSLLLAVWPLCRARRDVQDYVVMLLRKSMFSRELHARLLAARGFLYMIIEELKDPAVSAGGTGAWNQAGSSSQGPSLSQMSTLSGSPGGATLLHELMSFLRRCLSQQAEVRRALYDGMPAVLAADPSAQECIIEPLLPHFCQFYETDEQLNPPLKLENCARLQGEAVRVAEPLQHQLAGLRRVLRTAADLPAGATEAGNFNLGTDLTDLGAQDAGAMADALRKHFQALRRRLVDCTLEDFNFDGSTEFGPGQPAGDLNQAAADILLGCMEVMMEDLVDEIWESAGSGGGGGGGGGGATAARLAVEVEKLFAQHQRLLDIVAESKKGSKGKKVEGLTQAVGGRKAAGRPTAAAKTAAAAAGAGPAAPTLATRVPALSVGCLCKLLDAIVDDAAHLKLGRDTQFQTFVLSSALRVLQAAAGSDACAAIATGTAGSEDDSEAVRELLAVPFWQQLAKPLFRAVQMMVLSCARQRVVVVKGEKKEKDPTEALTQAALKALEQLLSMGRTAPGVAALLKDLPPPDEDAVREARLPASQELPEPQRVISQQLPHFKQLLDVLVEHCCGKELESLCASLQLLVGLLPAQEAACVGSWAVTACENCPPQAQHPGAAKGLVSLALRCASQSGMDPRCGPQQQPPARDVALLRSLADEIKAVMDEEEIETSDAYPIMNHTIKPVMGVLVSHLETLLSNLDWALTKLKTLANTSKEPGREQSLRQSQLRLSWEKASYERMRHLVEVCGVMVETRLTGPICEALLKSCTHLYKALGAAAKAQFAPKGTTQPAPPKAFQELVAAVNRSSTGQVYCFINDVHGQNFENDAAAGNVEEEGDKARRKRDRALANAASKARRESKLIPNLIFHIEDYEKHLIRLSKTGRLNLMITAKRSTNRDFKITLNADAQGAGGIQPQQQGGGGGGGGRPAKRAKRGAAEEELQQEYEEAPGERSTAGEEYGEGEEELEGEEEGMGED